MSKVARIVAAGMAALATPALAATLTDMRPIVLKPGVNALPALAPDGRDGLIVQGSHQGSPSADGSSVQFLVLLRQGEGWETVDAQAVPSGSSDLDFGGALIQASPHAGEDWKRAVAFARAKVDGAPAFVMLVADRDMRRVQTVYDPVPVDILTYRLQKDPGWDQDHFVLADRKRTPRCYVNAWLALKDMTGFPLPTFYDGDGAASPCPK